MPNLDHISILQRGIAAWNKWREDHPGRTTGLIEKCGAPHFLMSRRRNLWVIYRPGATGEASSRVQLEAGLTIGRDTAKWVRNHFPETPNENDRFAPIRKHNQVLFRSAAASHSPVTPVAFSVPGLRLD